jgi:hypothetical protein
MVFGPVLEFLGSLLLFPEPSTTVGRMVHGLDPREVT